MNKINAQILKLYLNNILRNLCVIYNLRFIEYVFTNICCFYVQNKQCNNLPSSQECCYHIIHEIFYIFQLASNPHDFYQCLLAKTQNILISA